MKYCRVIKDFREEISHIQNNIKALEDEVARNQIGCTNVDDFVKKTKSLAKSIMESHIYSNSYFLFQHNL